MTPIAAVLPAGISPDHIGEGAGDITNIVADTGWTIGVERALAMDPDLILAVGADDNRENCERYRSAIAPFCFPEVVGDGSDEDVKDTLTGIATAIGREDAAEEAIAAYAARVRELRARVDRTDLVDTRIGVVRIDAGGFLGIRTRHTANTILRALGLPEPDWPAATVDGNAELSLERLGVLDRADILLVNTDDDVVIEDPVVFQSPLWHRLGVVREGRADLVGAWNGSDMPQLMRMLDDIEETLVGPAEARR